MNLVAYGIFFLVLALQVRGEEGLIEQSDQSLYIKDGLYLKVALLDNPQAFLSEWKAAKKQPPMLNTRTVFHRGDVIFPVVMFSTNALNPEGKADITYNLLFRRPDGSIYEHQKDLIVVDGPPPKGIGLSKSKAGLKIEESDPYGDYTLKVTITDNIKQVPVEMLFTFSVVDPNAKASELPAMAGIRFTEPEPVPSPTPFSASRIRSLSGDRW